MCDLGLDKAKRQDHEKGSSDNNSGGEMASIMLGLAGGCGEWLWAMTTKDDESEAGVRHIWYSESSSDRQLGVVGVTSEGDICPF